MNTKDLSENCELRQDFEQAPSELAFTSSFAQDKRSGPDKLMKSVIAPVESDRTAG